MARKGKTLSLKERRFINAYMGTARGNGVAAAREAGYKGNPNVLHVQASRLLRKPTVKAELESRVERRDAQAILDADARDALLSKFALKSGARLQDRISAVKELNKVSGRHSITLHHKGKLTLEEALEQAHG